MTFQRAVLAISVLNFLSILACSKPSQNIDFVDETRLMMDTVVRIVVYDQEQSKSEIRKAMASAFARISEIENRCSGTIDSSEICQINRNAGIKAVKISGDVHSILAIAREYSQISSGAFDVSISPVLGLWNFLSADKQYRRPEIGEVQEKLPLVNYQNILLNDSSVFLSPKGMALDLGAIAKGFAVDQAYETLLKAGIRDFMIDAGGNLRFKSGDISRGKRRVWMKHPRRPGFLWGYFKQDDGCVATSGDYERFFMVDSIRYHHILNPKTGFPASGCYAVTVTAATATQADALSTVLFILGPEEGLNLAEKLDQVEAVFLFAGEHGMKIESTSGLKGKLVEQNQQF